MINGVVFLLKKDYEKDFKSKRKIKQKKYVPTFIFWKGKIVYIIKKKK